MKFTSANNVDTIGDSLATAERLNLQGGFGFAQSVLETADDWDVYQVDVKPGRWYAFDAYAFSGVNLGLFRRTDGGSELIDPTFFN